MSKSTTGRRSREDWPLGLVVAFFAFVATANLAWIGLVVWLIIAAIQWLGRN